MRGRPDKVGRGPSYMRRDVPGEQLRIYADAEGVDHVFVNGIQIIRHGQHTGKLPGTVFRSGRDTRTVAIDALRDKAWKRRGDAVGGRGPRGCLLLYRAGDRGPSSTEIRLGRARPHQRRDYPDDSHPDARREDRSAGSCGPLGL